LAVIIRIYHDARSSECQMSKSCDNYSVPPTCFSIYKANIREAVYKGTEIQQLLSKMCKFRVTIQNH